MSIEYNVSELITGSHSGSVAAINSAGDACGQIRTDPIGQQYFGTIWSGGSRQLIAEQNAFFAINDEGDVAGGSGPGPVGGSSNEFFNRPVEPGRNGVVIYKGQKTELFVGDGMGSLAFGINNKGLVSGTVKSDQFGGFRGFVYDSNSRSETLIAPLAGATDSTASAINQSGVIVGWCGRKTPSQYADGRIFTFSQGHFSEIGPSESGLPGFWLDINDVGQIIALGNSGPVIYDPRHANLGFVSIPLPSGFTDANGSFANGINNQGDVVGAHFNNQSIAWIYSRGVTKDLNTLISSQSGWVLNCAYDINDLGHIVGQGTLFGRRALFLLKPLTSISISQSARTIVGLVQIIYGVIQDGGGLTSGGPVPPSGPIREMLIGILVAEIAKSAGSVEAREIERAAMRLIAKVAQAEER
jgi:uncharacterized membrane protein